MVYHLRIFRFFGILLGVPGCLVALDESPLSASGRIEEARPAGAVAVSEDSLQSLKATSQAGDTVSLRRLLSMLDLSAPGCSEMRSLYDAGNSRGAVHAYLEILAARSANLPGVTPFSYWLYGPADAGRLIDGELDFTRYGDTSSRLSTRIGPPGQIRFFRPSGDYATSIRDISSMHWATKHAEAYAKTGEAKYLRAWLATWDDFFSHWDGQYAALRENPASLGLDPHVVAGVKGTDCLNTQLNSARLM